MFLIAIFVCTTFSLNASSTTTIEPVVNLLVVTPKVDGGPRTVIQAMTDITVTQPTSTNLYITIKNSSGDAVIEAETQSEQTVISIEELESGSYTVETVDDYNDYQEFSITIN